MTAEAKVWEIVSRAKVQWDFSLTIRSIAEKIGYSTGAVGKTLAWKGYTLFRREHAAVMRAAPPVRRRYRRARSGSMTAEGRVWEVVRKALRRRDFSLTVSQITARTRLSRGAVGGSIAWRGYADAREREAAANKQAHAR